MRKLKDALCKLMIAVLLTAFVVNPFVGILPGGMKVASGADNSATNSSNMSSNDNTSASAGNTLPVDSSQTKQIEQLGLSTEQPGRTSRSGKEVDKSENPLGPSTVVVNRNYQMAYTYESKNSDQLRVYENPIGTNEISLTSSKAAISKVSGQFDANHKKLLAVDTDGNGKQEVAEIGFVGTKNTGYKLQLFISDYNNLTEWAQPTTSNVYTVDTLSDYTDSDVAYASDAVYCTAGDINKDGSDEIIIATGKNIYICKATLSSLSILTKSDFGSQIDDVDALDADDDGFPELLITIGSSGTKAEILAIYDGIDLLSPTAKIELKTGQNRMISASVDVGDIFGNANNTIVIGGVNTSLVPSISYIQYDPETDSYDKKLTKMYSMLSDSQTDFHAVNSKPDIKCAKLAGNQKGTPDSVVFSGFIFNYNQTTDAFDRQTITTYTENSSNVSVNQSKKSEDSITDVNNQKDKTYIIETLVGNFDGNTEGKEQIIMLHYNTWYGNDYVYLTQCYMEKDRTITSQLNELYKKTKNSEYPYPAISPVDIENHSTTMKYLPDKSSFVYSDPIILAVLGASPYYSELEDKYGAVGNVDTTYGTESEHEKSFSNGVSLSAGILFGYEKGFDICGVEVLKIEFEAEVKSTFTGDFSESKSVSKGVAYTNYYSEDAVVLTVVPYDVYTYEVTTWNNNTKEYDTGEVTMQVPYSPLTTMTTVEAYNKAATKIPNAPTIPDAVLQHTIGDPRSYPSSSKGLSNVSDKNVLEVGSNDEASLQGTGIGNNSSSQSIVNSTSSTNSFEYELSIDVSFSASSFGYKAGVSAGASYKHGLSATSTQSTTRSGSVAAVPSGYDRYQFRWALVAYNYDLSAGNSKQRCTVINYICRPLGKQYPPKMPDNLKINSQDLLSNTLKWDAAVGAAGYEILRSTDEYGTYLVVANIEGSNKTSYQDKTIEQGRTYYYELKSYNSIPSRATDPLKAEALRVTGMLIKKQPKLSYKEYDQLDLSEMVVTLMLGDNQSIDVKYADFPQYNLATSMSNGEELDADSSGTPITVEYDADSIKTNTGMLAIKACSAYPIDLTVNFTVGSNSKAVTLIAGKQLSAAIGLENTSDSQLQMIVILALYDAKGTMVQYVAKNVSLGANKSESVTNDLTLPSDISGCTAKVFVWDGKSLSSSNLTSLADFVQIPTY